MSQLQRRTPWVIILAVLAALLSAALPVGAQESNGLEILQVDMRQAQAQVVFKPVPGSAGESVTISTNGDELAVTDAIPLRRSPVGAFTVLVVDDSMIADQVAGFTQVQQAALTYLSSINANTKVMLVRGGGGNPEVRAVVPFTTDHQSVRDAVSAMRPSGGSVMWNAISRSAEQFAAQGDGIRNVVAFVASNGASSTIPASVAEGSLLSADAYLTVVLPQADNLESNELAEIAAATRGGSIHQAAADESMTIAAGKAAGAQESVLYASFDKSVIEANTFTLELAYGGSEDRVRFSPDSIASGSALKPPVIVERGRFDVLSGSTGALVVVGLGVLAALLFAFSMMWIFAGNDDSLNTTLSVYGMDHASDEELVADDAFASVRSKFVEQVVERAETAAESRGKMQTTQALLTRAEVPLRVGEAYAVQVGIVVAAFALTFLLSRNVIVALIVAVIIGFIPMTLLKMKVGRRRKKLESQLPDTLMLLSSTLKAGYSFLQGIDAVGNEAEEPLAGEFRQTVNEARLGKEIDEALDDLAERVESIDLLWAVIAIKIQREVGGNLAEVLATVADTMTQRSRLKGEIAALTAEGRISALVLIVLPFLVGIAMYFMNRDYISTLWTSGLFGWLGIGAGALGMVVGSLWMRKIIDIKI